MTRTLLLAAVLGALCVLPRTAVAIDYFDDASNNQIVGAYNELNEKCRGGAGDLTMAWCGVRDLLYNYMTNRRNLCFGKKGQARIDRRWHTCGRNSLR